MERHLFTRGIAAASLVVAITAAIPARAQVEEPAQTIVYSRSMGEYDAPELNEIFVINEDGTGEVRLTENMKEDTFPAFSPDSNQIAFSRLDDPYVDIYKK